MRRLLITAALAAAAANAHALEKGDVAFLGFNADVDNWSLVAFADLPANTQIFFGDNEWNGTGFADTNEHTLLWNTGSSAITAGTVVLFTEIDGTVDIISASLGTLSLASGGGSNLGLSASDETLYAYLGSSATTPTAFLAGLSTQGSTHLTPAGLTGGSDAVVLTNSTDFAQYTGPRTGKTWAEYQSLVTDAANWQIVVGGDNSGAVLNTTAFAAVPEAETWAMMALGLGLVGVLRRRIA